MSMTSQQPPNVRFAASWSTQFRFTQAIGRGLSELMRVNATVHVLGPGGLGALNAGEVDVVYSKWVVNEHRHTGRGIYAGAAPDEGLRTIAWLPQEDRFLFAVAPWTGIESFEQLAAEQPALRMAGSGGEAVLQEYGFSYADIEKWGGAVGRMEHTARAAKERYDAGELDAFFGDGSAYDFSAWPWVGARGYRFLDVGEEAMRRLEAKGLRRQITPAGFVPGIDRTLTALDDSHIVVTCRADLDDEVAYNLAKAIDAGKRDIELSSIQIDYDNGEGGGLPMIRPTYWSSLTGPIGRQWDERFTGAPLHDGARRYYREQGYL